MNSIGARIGLVYTLGAGEPDRRAYNGGGADMPRHFSYDLTLYGSAHKEIVTCGELPVLVPGSFGVLGVGFAPMYNFHRMFRAGVSARAELVMPVFSVNVGLGRNLVGPESTRGFYQTLALKAHVWRSAYIHVGYRLSDFQHPEHLMIGIGYTFHNKR